ncbi:hypothetical protein L207DRAFT_518386 [Hyaloscypha variabilis F]|uniref:Heterokaryon incompatibility domain-containing protein n=1 Tax=Hyaloscypha variabilis (strain UAMH 11265 / GT02V1 / F) TaxID=1149755 RepID=A0A2J6R3D7_HYAVF|nr:hypothetical protein L207DRAFT_518386 [Hyaloscypha variabilis F]
MKVTKKLRYRFLWVDRYCIRQDDPADKARQIPLMGLIYGLAEVTLIGAAGTDPSYGLPGVGRRHRKPQPRATVAGGRTLLWDLGDPKELIEKAVWSTRGWTYQEALLSRRRLAFSDRQVYFECGTMYCCEASDVLPDITQKTESLYLAYLYPLHTVGRNAHDFTQRVSEYSKRRFGNPADVLDGLQGILRFFEQGEQPIYNLFGIPILPPVAMSKAQGEWVKTLPRSLSDGFLVALCWEILGFARRRSMFPSWSWAGWEYDEGFLSMATTSIDVLKGQTGITVALESTEGQKMEWCEFEAKLGSWDYTHSLSHILTITCGTFDVQIKYLTKGDEKVQDDGPYAKISNAKGAAARYHRYRPLIEADESPDRDWSRTSLVGVHIGPLDVEITNSRSLTSFILVAEKMGENCWKRVGQFYLGIYKNNLEGVDQHKRTVKHLLPLIWKEIRLG